MGQSSIFPYMLVRVAGGPFGDLKKMELGQTLRIVNDIEKTEQQLEETKRQISERFYFLIQEASSKTTRNTLIAIRRDVYNMRPVAHVSGKIKSNMSLNDRQLLETYASLHEKAEKLNEKGRVLYSKEFQNSKRTFCRLTRGSNFRSGILLSSHTMTESLDKHIGAGHNTNSLLSKTERSLMQYLSRMYTKTSPLSTFTHTGITKIKESEHYLSRVKNANAEMKIKSRVELNHFIFQYLTDLILRDKRVRGRARIKLNFTIRESEKTFKFFITSNRGDVLQAVTVTPALSIIYAVLQTRKVWVYNELVAVLTTKTQISASQEEIALYIDSLLDCGFFEYDLGISGFDREWDRKMINYLAPLAQTLPHLKILARTLRTLKSAATNYETASFPKRKLLLARAYNDIGQTAHKLNRAAGRSEPPSDTREKKHLKPSERVQNGEHAYFAKHNVWYEDTYANNASLPTPNIKTHLGVMGDFFSRMGTIATCLDERYDMAYFFINQYGPHAKVDLLQFYEAYLREVKNSQKAAFGQNPFLAQRHEKNEQLLATVTARIKNQLTSGDQIYLARQDIAHIPHSKSPSSFGVFFQIASPVNEPMIIVNDTAGNFGSLFGRFLHLFDSSIIEALRSWNKRAGDSILLAEATDASIFNFNVHPPLFPYEIHIPGGHHAFPEAHWIWVTNLEMRYNHHNHRLQLFDTKRQKEVFVFNMGFQAINTRSDLYAFLSLFAPGTHHHITPLTEHINMHVKSGVPQEDIQVLPRLVYEQSIVLQRKTWLIPPSLFPPTHPGGDEWSYFLQINLWRRALGMPDEIFILGPKEKPQYISFRNPLLVQLFRRLLEKTGKATHIRVQEMSPAGEQLATLNDKKIVTEHLAQFYQ